LFRHFVWHRFCGPCDTALNAWLKACIWRVEQFFEYLGSFRFSGSPRVVIQPRGLDATDSILLDTHRTRRVSCVNIQLMTQEIFFFIKNNLWCFQSFLIASRRTAFSPCDDQKPDKWLRPLRVGAAIESAPVRETFFGRVVMKHLSMSRLFVLLAICSTLVCTNPQVTRAGNITVNAGYDLLQTAGTTQFMGISFTSIPLNTFDFGGSIGVKTVLQTDTILQRMSDAVATASGDTVRVAEQLDALQMRSVNPYTGNDFGTPITNQYLYVTLQSARVGGGTISTGYSDITINSVGNGQSGTFSSHLDVFYDIHAGSLTATPIFSNSSTFQPLVLDSLNNPWQNTVPTGTNSPMINLVNYKLNGTSTLNDFWLAPHLDPVTHLEVISITHDASGANHHDVVPAVCPEPGSFAMLAIGAMSLAGYRWRQRAKKS
jgi:hypothetical protein